MQNTPNKIIQIATTPETESDWQTIFALTEGGDIWKLPITQRSLRDWEKLPPLPSEPNVAPERASRQEIPTPKTDGN